MLFLAVLSLLSEYMSELEREHINTQGATQHNNELQTGSAVVRVAHAGQSVVAIHFVVVADCVVLRPLAIVAPPWARRWRKRARETAFIFATKCTYIREFVCDNLKRRVHSTEIVYENNVCEYTTNVYRVPIIN